MDDTIDTPAAAPAPRQTVSGYDAGRDRPMQTPGGAATAADPWAALPAKFQIKGADGQLDRDASVARMTKSYGELEKRFSGGQQAEGRPASAAEYAVQVPETLQGAFDPATDAGFGEFAKGAHELGFTSEQMQYVVDAYGRVATDLVGGARELDGEAAIAELRTTWKTDAVYDENISLANRALRQLGNDSPALRRSVDNNPELIRFMALVGAQLGEDSPPSADIGSGGHAPDGPTLQRHPAYSDASHPDHKAVSARVRAWYERNTRD